MLRSIGLTLPPLVVTPAKPNGALEQFKDSVVESRESFAHEFGKLGVLATAAVGTFALPMAAAALVPAIAGVALSYPGYLASMLVISLEESRIGVGRHIGEAAGWVLGTGAGAVKGVVNAIRGKQPEEPTPYALPQRAATGAHPHEALMPRGFHAAERLVGIQQGPRTRAVELGENIGAFAATTVAGFAFPVMMAAAGIGGPIALIGSTLVGSLCGIVLGGMEESSLGVGRFVGEVAGRAVDGVGRLFGRKPKAAATPAPPRADSKFGNGLRWVGKHALHGMEVVSEPLVTFLLDASQATNRVFGEKAWQTIPFAARPEPKVNEQRVLDNFQKLAGIPGTWQKEQAIGDEILGQLASMGITGQRNGDGVIIATVPGTVPDAPTVLLSAHQDTVKPTSADAIRSNPRRFYTDGHHVLGGDDRAGCAEILEGLRTVLENKWDRPEIKLVFTTGEEAGLRGAARLHPDDISTRPTLGYVVDSTSVNDVFLTNDAVIIVPSSVKYNFSQEDPLIQVVMRSMANAGTPMHVLHAPIMTGAGSDANTPAFNSGVIRSLAVGAGERDIHTGFENIHKKDLIQGAKHVVGYITNATDLKVDGDRIVARG